MLPFPTSTTPPGSSARIVSRTASLALLLLVLTGCSDGSTAGDEASASSNAGGSSGSGQSDGGAGPTGSATGSGASGASGGTGGSGAAPASCGQPECTLVVATDGDDGAAGTESDPFATIQHAADVAEPGDVICARAGSYDGVALATSGTADAPITLQSYPGEVATVDTVGFFAGWGMAVGWVVVQGLEIIQTYGSPSDSGQCVYVHSAHDITIAHNDIHDCYGQGILGNATQIVIDGNRISYVGGWSLGDSEAYNKYHGIYLSGSAIQVVNNVIHHNAAYGIQVAGYPWDPDEPNHPAGPEYMGASGWLISNNVFAFNQNRSGIVVWQPAATDAVIQNNVFLSNGEQGPNASGTNGVDFYGSGGGHQVHNNVYFGAGAPVTDTSSGASYLETSPFETDPLFVDAKGGDFHLSQGAPGIDTGTVPSAPDHDAECQPRPQGQGVDVGAYEL